jgi:hypothetical protein
LSKERGNAPIVSSASGALFSSCRRWRYLLWRQWDPAKPVANFLMLNPSTADEFKLDPSCTRARRYAEAWGYGSLIVTNVFGFRSTDPGKLRTTSDPIGAGNDAAILRAAKEAEIVVCAWGNHGSFLERSARIRVLLKKQRLHALRVNANGEPAHPLYLPGNLRPCPWA